jgi:hypothetical protein
MASLQASAAIWSNPRSIHNCCVGRQQTQGAGWRDVRACQAHTCTTPPPPSLSHAIHKPPAGRRLGSVLNSKTRRVHHDCCQRTRCMPSKRVTGASPLRRSAALVDGVDVSRAWVEGEVERWREDCTRHCSHTMWVLAAENALRLGWGLAAGGEEHATGDPELRAATRASGHYSHSHDPTWSGPARWYEGNLL